MKRRTLKLAEPLAPEVVDQVIDCIEAMMGIHKIEVNGNRITLVYDLIQAIESQIQQAISDAGIVLGASLMEKIRRTFVHFLEETEIDSMEARPGAKGGHRH